MRCWISTTARVSCVRAGILPLLWIRADGSLNGIGAGKMPSGMFGRAEYEDHSLTQDPSDWLCLCSDGVSGYDSPQGELPGEVRLRCEQQAQSHALAAHLLQALAALSCWHYPDEEAPRQHFSDDISRLMITCGADGLQGRIEGNI